MPISHDVKDLSLAESGRRRIDWAARQMPVVTAIGDEFLQRRPLQHVQIAACLHVTTETACLISALKAGGASVRLCASNPLSTQDDVAAALVVDAEIPVFAIRGEDESTYFRHIEQVLEVEPHITMDDGADLVTTLHRKWPEVADRVRGGTEETTTGVIRLRAMARTNELRYPVIAVNDALTKHLFDNRYGTGQSAIAGSPCGQTGWVPM